MGWHPNLHSLLMAYREEPNQSGIALNQLHLKYLMELNKLFLVVFLVRKRRKMV